MHVSGMRCWLCFEAGLGGSGPGIPVLRTCCVWQEVNQGFHPRMRILSSAFLQSRGLHGCINPTLEKNPCLGLGCLSPVYCPKC